MRMRFLLSTAIFGAGFAATLSLASPSPVYAQAGTSQPTLSRTFSPHPLQHPLQQRALWPHEMMSWQERYELSRTLHKARSVAERYDIWAKKIAELEKRASDHGVILRDQGPMMAGGGERFVTHQEDLRWGRGYAPEQPMMAGGWQGPQYGPGAMHERPMMSPGGWSAPHYGGAHPSMPPMGR